MKKLASMALALALCLTLTVPAFAADYKPYSIRLDDDDYFASTMTVDATSVEEKTVKFLQFISDTYKPTTIIHVVPGSTLKLEYDNKSSTIEYEAYKWQSEGSTSIDAVIRGPVFFGIVPHGDEIYSTTITRSIDEIFDEAKRETGFTAPIIGINFKHFRSEENEVFLVLDTADSAIPSTPAQPQQPAAAGFTDVAADAYYAAPVAWAVEKNITSGTSATTFSPNQTCTQAQILTFLWRAKGSPEPAGWASLPGVDPGAYYYKAAAWAMEQGMIDGGFSAETPCTRAMAVTYMWKQAGSPAAGNSAFTDVPAGAAYAQAVAWAVNKGVTSGTGNNQFSPDQTCTRAQIVSFLYRAFVN